MRARFHQQERKTRESFTKTRQRHFWQIERRALSWKIPKLQSRSFVSIALRCYQARFRSRLKIQINNAKKTQQQFSGYYITIAKFYFDQWSTYKLFLIIVIWSTFDIYLHRYKVRKILMMTFSAHVLRKWSFVCVQKARKTLHIIGGVIYVGRICMFLTCMFLRKRLWTIELENLLK